jgi:hypothetical protein
MSWLFLRASGRTLLIFFLIFKVSESLFAIRSHRECAPSKSLLGGWVESTFLERQVRSSQFLFSQETHPNPRAPPYLSRHSIFVGLRIPATHFTFHAYKSKAFLSGMHFAEYVLTKWNQEYATWKNRFFLKLERRHWGHTDPSQQKGCSGCLHPAKMLRGQQHEQYPQKRQIRHANNLSQMWHADCLWADILNLEYDMQKYSSWTANILTHYNY